MPQAIGLAIGGFLFNIGAPLALVNFFAIGGGGSLLVGLGLSLAAGALQQRPGGGSAAIKPSDGQQEIRQAVPPRIKSYGRVRITGAVWWLEANSSGVLHQGQAVNQGEIDAFEEYFVDDAQVAVTAGSITTAPYSTLASGGKEFLTRLGEATETAYAEIEAEFDVADVRGDGVATLLGIFDNFIDSETQFENFPKGRPTLRVTIRASKVWDWRDAAQDREDPTTWGWSENEVVCRLNYLMDADAGMGIPWARFEDNIAEWTAAADVCDEQALSVAAGGVEDRYRIALTYALTDRPADVLKRFEAASDGRTWQRRDGSIGCSVGVFTTPSVTIPSRHIIAYDFTRGQDRLASVAGIRAQYMSPGNDYREQDAEPWPDGETVLALGEDRTAALDLTTVPSHGQARRLMKRAYLRANAGWRGTIRTNLFGLKAIDERFINVTIEELGIETSFEVSKLTLDLARNEVQLELVEVTAAIDEFDAATEEGDAAGQTVSTAFESPQTLEIPKADGSYRSVISGVELVASGNQSRFVFGGEPTVGFTVSHASVVPRSGSTDDGTATPTEITFNGASGFSVAAGEQIVSDWIDFPIALGTDYLVIVDFSGGEATFNGGSTTYYLNSNTWDQQTVAGTSSGGGIAFLAKIEVRAG